MRKLCFILALWGCDDGGQSTPSPEQEAPAPDAGAEPEPEPSCTPETFAVYDPASDLPHVFPDDVYTADADTPTGLRVQMDAPWIASIPGGYGLLYEQMGTLDGFGTTAAVFLAFDRPIDVEDAADKLRLVDLGDDVAVDVPFELVSLEKGQLLALWPILPLRSGTAHGVIGADLLDEGGGCVGPAPLIAKVLAGDGEGRLGELAPRYQDLLDRTNTVADAVSAAVVFTTQSVFDSSAAVAGDIRDRDFSWDGAPECSDSLAGLQRCELTFTANDYRKEGVTQPEPVEPYTLPVSVWLPKDDSGPWPVVIAGHGLSGDRTLGQFVSTLTGGGVAVVAIDAVGHGEHPGGRGDNQVTQFTEFFEFDILTKTVDGLALRDNFRQSTFDKLQLVEVLRQNPDLDGDGEADLLVDSMTYFGASLGGIMGPEFVALSDAIGAAVFGIPGARLSQIMRDSASFAPLVRTLVPANATDGDKERVFAALQTVIERGDPMNFAARVQHARLPGTGEAAPQVLVIMAVGDEIVPNSATFNLVRALQAPVVPPVLIDVGHVPTVDRAPVKGNVAGGAATAGLFQYELVTYVTGPRGQRRVIEAGHESVLTGREVIYQFQQFFRSWLEDGVATIVDPFERLGVPRR